MKLTTTMLDDVDDEDTADNGDAHVDEVEKQPKKKQKSSKKVKLAVDDDDEVPPVLALWYVVCLYTCRVLIDLCICIVYLIDMFQLVHDAGRIRHAAAPRGISGSAALSQRAARRWCRRQCQGSSVCMNIVLYM